MKKKTAFDRLPIEIQEKMLERQVEQGNKRDREVFRKNVTSDKHSGGFGWHKTIEEYSFWNEIIAIGNTDHFYTLYPKNEEKTFSKEEMIEFGKFVKDIPASWHSFNPIKKVVETVLFSDYLKMKERLKKEAERNKDTLIELEKEQDELSKKIIKLTEFEKNNDFDNIDEMLISVQLQAMNTHNECLIQRIYNTKQK